MSENTSIIKDFKEQYLAALKMTGDVIVKCREDLWQDLKQEVVVSQLVYHILASADYCLCKTNDERDSFQRKYGESGFSFNDQTKDFTKRQLAEYLEEIKSKADNFFKIITIEELTVNPIYDLSGTISLFTVLVNNLRHIMLHVGALHARLTMLENEPLPYVRQVYGDERDKLEEKNDQGVVYIQQGELDEAEELYLEICGKSDQPLYHYNLACVYSRKGNTEKAIASLKFCLESSNQWQHKFFSNLAKTDSDLSSIQELPAFEELLNQ